MIIRTLLITLFLVQLPANGFALNNRQDGMASTDIPFECSNPPYSTHDWVADHALALLPDDEKAWIIPHKAMYLLGTEAPTKKGIPDQCDSPNHGYDDWRYGHSVEWKVDGSGFAKKNGRLLDQNARRAQEEYSKAVIAYEQGELSDAAFYLGAMAHYIGDVTQYGHSVPFEQHPSDYEGWVGRHTKAFDGGDFESYIALDTLVRSRPYTAVKRISKVTWLGKGKILSAEDMDRLYPEKKNNQLYKDSVGHSLNLGANELADVLHTFYLNVVAGN